MTQQNTTEISASESTRNNSQNMADTTMSRTEIPDWKNMPKDESLISLSWQDIHPIARDQLKRDPTEQEVRDLFGKIHARLSEEISLMYSHMISELRV